MMRRSILTALAVAMALAAACSSEAARQEPPAAPPMPSQIQAATFGLGSTNPGERLFGRECAYCHVGKNTGTVMLQHRLPKDTPAQLHERQDLTADYVKAVVRQGLVNMPPLSRVEVSDAELDQIASFLARENGR